MKIIDPAYIIFFVCLIYVVVSFIIVDPVLCLGSFVAIYILKLWTERKLIIRFYNGYKICFFIL